MPCHPARARELIGKGEAVRRFKGGIFYIQLIERKDGAGQDIAVGIDPGSQKEGFTVKSKAHTFLNIQSDAVTWVKEAIKTRREMRRGRRTRKNPYRANRKNRSRSPFPPSTKARWQAKLRICKILSQLYPIKAFVVEDIKARTWKGGKRWNTTFSPLEVGKKWFYEELSKLGEVHKKQGIQTKQMREVLGLKKSKKKTANIFEAHCVDSFVLANWYVGGDVVDNQQMFLFTPLRFHRRQLHRLQPSKGGIRKPYGGTISEGFKRGSLIKHPKFAVAYVGGTLKGRISLHSIETGKRLTQNAKPEDCQFLTYNYWRVRNAS